MINSTVNTGAMMGTVCDELSSVRVSSDWSVFEDTKGRGLMLVPFFFPLFSMDSRISSTELVSLSFLLNRLVDRLVR